MNEYQRQTDCQACQITCALLAVGCAEHNEHKYEGEDHLSQECLQHLALAERICARCGRCAEATRRRQNVDQSCTDDCANHLSDHITNSVLAAHTTREPYAQRNCGVDVAARNAANAVSHTDYRKTKCKCNGQHLSRSRATKEYGTAATHQYENHRTDHFC